MPGSTIFNLPIDRVYCVNPFPQVFSGYFCRIAVDSAGSIIYRCLMLRTMTHCLACCFIGLTVLGCGSKPASRVPVFKVSGTVMYKGKPVTDADVTFHCQDQERAAFGRTDEQGKFRLSTFRPNDGAVAGKHAVTVVKVEAAATQQEAPLEDPAYNPDAVAKQAPVKPPKSSIPAKYASEKTTDLFYVVLDDGQNEEAVLELKD